MTQGIGRAIMDGKKLDRRMTVDAFGQSYTRPTDIDHDNIHAGTTYQSSVFNASLASGAEQTVTIAVGAGVEAHARTRIAGLAPLRVRLSESPTLGGSPSSVTQSNRNRRKADSPSHTVQQGATITSRGTVLKDSLVPGSLTGGGFFSSGSSGEAFTPLEEWVLAPGRTYLLGVANLDSESTQVSIELILYERAV